MGAAACSAERCGCAATPLATGLSSIGLELRRGGSAACHDSCHGLSVSSSIQLHVDGSSDSSENEVDQVGAFSCPAASRSRRGSLGQQHREFQCKALKSKQAFRGGAGDARIVQETLLHAARCGNFKQTVDAVDQGADVHGTTLRGQTPLMLAASSQSAGTLEIIKFLIDAQADVNAKDELGWTPLFYACRNSSQQSAELLIEKGASIHMRANDGKTPAMMAAIDGCDGLVMQLLERKAAVDDSDKAGWTVLGYACEEGHCALVKFLLKMRANANKAAEDKTTPLMIAAGRGDTKVGELLLKRNVGLNVRNAEGDTALLVSLKAHREHFALWIIGLGANLTMTNNAGEDARSLSNSPEFSSVKHILDQKLRSKESAVEAGAVRSSDPDDYGL